jgi:hypothetical protein
MPVRNPSMFKRNARTVLNTHRQLARLPPNPYSVRRSLLQWELIVAMTPFDPDTPVWYPVNQADLSFEDPGVISLLMMYDLISYPEYGGEAPANRSLIHELRIAHPLKLDLFSS